MTSAVAFLCVCFAVITFAQNTQLRIQFTGVLNEYSISWQSENDLTPMLKFGYEPNHFNQTVTGNATKFSACVLYKSITKEVFIKVKENSQIYFQIQLNSGTWSKMFQFKSTPEKQESFEFIAYGDTDTTQNTKIVMEKVLTEKNSSFVLHAGDFAYDSISTQEIWDDWGNLFEPLTSSKPFVAVVGNHEFHCFWRFENFNNRFTKRIGENSRGNGNFYYSMTYSNVMFFILSSEHVIDPPSEQFKWFERELAKVDRNKTPWIIVSYHQPAYSSLQQRYPGNRILRNLEPLMVKYKVALVISGHDHCYERTCNVLNAKCGVGPIHITVGTAGRRLYGPFRDPKPEWSIFREASYGYSKIKVTKQEISVQFIRLNGTIGDEFKIKA
jgi:acid phosphatase type 7